jgi:hypothetical protein
VRGFPLSPFYTAFRRRQAKVGERVGRGCHPASAVDPHWLSETIIPCLGPYLPGHSGGRGEWCKEGVERANIWTANCHDTAGRKRGDADSESEAPIFHVKVTFCDSERLSAVLS